MNTQINCLNLKLSLSWFGVQFTIKRKRNVRATSILFSILYGVGSDAFKFTVSVKNISPGDTG